MAKRIESTLVNMILSLMLISMGMSATLTFVYLKTKGPIENAAKQKEISAIKQVLPAFNSDPIANQFQKQGLKIYAPENNNQPVGYAIKTYSDKGFGGKIELMAGFLSDSTIHDITVLQQKETPGLGTRMTEDKFKNQFIGKNPDKFILKVKKDGGDVDAISAATISSRAYCDALQRAYDSFKQVEDSISTK